MSFESISMCLYRGMYREELRTAWRVDVNLLLLNLHPSIVA